MQYNLVCRAYFVLFCLPQMSIPVMPSGCLVRKCDENNIYAHVQCTIDILTSNL